jgi:hypothetical protein
MVPIANQQSVLERQTVLGKSLWTVRARPQPEKCPRKRHLQVAERRTPVEKPIEEGRKQLINGNNSNRGREGSLRHSELFCQIEINGLPLSGNAHFGSNLSFQTNSVAPLKKFVR